MRRREFVRGAGALAGGGVCGGVVASDALARREPIARQVVDGGVAQPRTVLSVVVDGSIDAVDADHVHLSVPVVDPITAETTRRTVGVAEASAAGSRLELVVDGPVSRGSVVSFEAWSLVVDGRMTGGFALPVDGPLVSPARATQWFKAYEPTDVDRFRLRVYPDGAPPRRVAVDDDPTAVRARLAAHLDRFVDRRRLTPDGRDAALGRFDSPTTRTRFVDHRGAFDPVALAGVLANAGTAAGGLDAVVLDGENRFGRPYTVRRRPPPSGGLMEVRVDAGEPTILVSPRLDGEPFAVLAPLFAHEGLHQDLAVGLDEEVVATYLETLVWAEHLLCDPELARLGTPRTRRANTMLLIALNSGRRSFPEMGLRTAPHRQGVDNATPGATDPVVDFVTAVESSYLQTLPRSSPGSPFARRVVERVTDASAATLDFDGETIDLLDERTRLFSTADVHRLLAALELRPATSAQTADPGADPVAVADAGGSSGAPAGWTVDGFESRSTGPCGTCRATDRTVD